MNRRLTVTMLTVALACAGPAVQADTTLLPTEAPRAIHDIRARAASCLHALPASRLRARHEGMVLYLSGLLKSMSGETPAADFAARYGLLRRILDGLDAGVDTLAQQRGHFEWAYFSRADGSGQPIMVDLPPDYDGRTPLPPGRRAPRQWRDPCLLPAARGRAFLYRRGGQWSRRSPLLRPGRKRHARGGRTSCSRTSRPIPGAWCSAASAPAASACCAWPPATRTSTPASSRTAPMPTGSTSPTSPYNAGADPPRRCGLGRSDRCHAHRGRGVAANLPVGDLHRIPGVGHGVFEPAQVNHPLAFLPTVEADPYPRELLYTTDQLTRGRCYWATITRFLGPHYSGTLRLTANDRQPERHHPQCRRPAANQPARPVSPGGDDHAAPGRTDGRDHPHGGRDVPRVPQPAVAGRSRREACGVAVSTRRADEPLRREAIVIVAPTRLARRCRAAGPYREVRDQRRLRPAPHALRPYPGGRGREV